MNAAVHCDVCDTEYTVDLGCGCNDTTADAAQSIDSSDTRECDSCGDDRPAATCTPSGSYAVAGRLVHTYRCADCRALPCGAGLEHAVARRFGGAL